MVLVVAPKINILDLSGELQGVGVGVGVGGWRGVLGGGEGGGGVGGCKLFTIFSEQEILREKEK